jgi:hypothetical protein
MKTISSPETTNTHTTAIILANQQSHTNLSSIDSKNESKSFLQTRYPFFPFVIGFPIL